MTIYFDMDGTIASLFTIANFSERLNNGDTSVFLECKPMFNANAMEEVITALKDKGYKIGIISYVRKENNPRQGRADKKAWLAEHFPYADEVHIVRETVSKWKVAKDKDNSYLIDDCKKNRKEWENGLTINAYKADIVKELWKLANR